MWRRSGCGLQRSVVGASYGNRFDFFFSWRRIGRLRGNWGHGVDSEEGPPWTGTIFHF